MIERKFPLYITKLIASYLKNRTFRVKLLDALSSVKTITAGVPQGSTLSPSLFNIFVSDLPHTDGVKLAQYADDTAILYRSTSPAVINGRLQTQLDAFDDWYSSWRMSVNPEKSTAVLFTRRLLRPAGPVRMSDTDIPWSNTAKYLGVTLDRGLRWTPHIHEKTRDARVSLHKLFPLLSSRSSMSLRNKLRVYKSIMRPQMLYAAPVWGNAAPSLINSIQRRQNRVLRLLVDAPWFVRNNQIHRELCIPTIADYIRELALKFFNTLERHPNLELRPSSSGYDEETKLRHKRPRTVCWRPDASV